MSESIAVGEEAAHELLVDDHHFQRGGIVAQIKIAAFDQRNLHRVEEAWRDQIAIDLHVLAWSLYKTFHFEAFPVPAAEAQGH